MMVTKSPCFQGIPLLRRGCPATLTLSQSQISCLLANAFFCTFPHRNAAHSYAEYHTFPTINFTRWGSTASVRYPTANSIAITCSVCELTHNSHSACSLFGNWSERKKEKLRAIMHYFKVTTDESELMANRLLLFCDVYSRWRSVTCWFLRRH